MYRYCTVYRYSIRFWVTQAAFVIVQGGTAHRVALIAECGCGSVAKGPCSGRGRLDRDSVFSLSPASLATKMYIPYYDMIPIPTVLPGPS